MKIKISEATNRQLDYLVALSQGYTDPRWHHYPWGDKELVMTSPTGRWIEFYNLDFTTNHALTGPLIEQERIDLFACLTNWAAQQNHIQPTVEVEGSTFLIAACRCIVAKHFGAEAEVPGDLT